MIKTPGPLGLKERIERAEATPFQKRVWKILLSIPRGEVRSYEWVAKRIGSPRAVRAVGNAVKKNPFAPFVPCHRVIRKNGLLGGYSRGIALKRKLLKREGKTFGSNSPPRPSFRS